MARSMGKEFHTNNRAMFVTSVAEALRNTSVPVGGMEAVSRFHA